jgi:hypothetical protein
MEQILSLVSPKVLLGGLERKICDALFELCLMHGVTEVL